MANLFEQAEQERKQPRKRQNRSRGRMFDGKTFDPAADTARLATTLVRVQGLMADGRWRTLSEIAEALSMPPESVPGISARLRDLRKEKFGGHTIHRRARGDKAAGLNEYRMVLRKVD